MLQCSVLCNFPSLFFCSIFQKISSCILQILLLRFSHLVVEFQFPPVSSFPEYLFKPLSVLTVVTSFLISLRIIICCCSVAKLCLTLLNPMDCSTWGFPVLHYLLEFAQIHVHSVSDAIQPSHLCPPLLLPPSVFPSVRVFSSESVLHIRWPKYWNFSFSISPSSEYSGPISFRMDWFDLLTVPGTRQESSPTVQFQSINCSVLSLLYGATFKSIHDYRKKT